MIMENEVLNQNEDKIGIKEREWEMGVDINNEKVKKRKIRCLLISCEEEF